MITGAVDTNLDATIQLVLCDSHDQQREVVAVIDTGFNGFLTLPPSLISELALQRRGRGRAMLAHGGIDLFDIYAVTVVWDGVRKTIEVDSANAGVLVGMALLHGYHLHIQVEDGGSTRIERLPNRLR